MPLFLTEGRSHTLISHGRELASSSPVLGEDECCHHDGEELPREDPHIWAAGRRPSVLLRPLILGLRLSAGRVWHDPSDRPTHALLTCRAVVRRKGDHLLNQQRGLRRLRGREREEGTVAQKWRWRQGWQGGGVPARGGASLWGRHRHLHQGVAGSPLHGIPGG